MAQGHGRLRLPRLRPGRADLHPVRRARVLPRLRRHRPFRRRPVRHGAAAACASRRRWRRAFAEGGGVPFERVRRRTACSALDLINRGQYETPLRRLLAEVAARGRRAPRRRRPRARRRLRLGRGVRRAGEGVPEGRDRRHRSGRRSRSERARAECSGQCEVRGLRHLEIQKRGGSTWSRCATCCTTWPSR